MKIIPEQIISLRKTIKLYDDTLNKQYLEDLKNNKADDMFKIQYKDYVSENMFNRSRDTLRIAYELLEKGEYVTDVETDCIDIGTKFTVYDEEYDEEETYILVETLEGVKSTDKYISTSSPMGKAVQGARIGDEIIYEVPAGKIKLVIKNIEQDKEKYIKPIRSVKTSSRMSKTIRSDIKESIKRGEDIQDEYKSITPSQSLLLRLELTRLSKNISRDNMIQSKKRISEIKELLERKVISENDDDTIGVGTIFSIELNTSEGKKIIKDAEMINVAVSNEYDEEYIERISPLGTKVLGLREEDSFIVRINRENVIGRVFNIRNSKTNKNSTIKKWL